MSREELKRVEVMSRVASGELKLGKAARILEVSYRQAKRIYRRYRKEGAAGLRHGSAGRASNRSKPKRFRRKVLKLVREKYSGGAGERFGPTLAAEHLGSEDGLQIDGETLRRWMLAEGLWSRERKRKAHRQRRERKEHFGELVQMDGSFEKWFEERGPKGCLMNLVDDATSTTVCRLGEEETTWAAAGVVRMWVESHGVPQALYTDWKNVYIREPTEKERREGRAPLTQFGRMCAKLGIRIIAASSPQAKGRVERSHGIHQDRLIKKMRRKTIDTFEAANQYLQEEYLPEHNQRFARAPAEPEDFHTGVSQGMDLDSVFRLEQERTIGNDWVVRYENRFLQIQRQSRHYAPARSKVTVCQWEDGRLEIFYREQKVAWKEIDTPAVAEALPRPAQKTVVQHWKSSKPNKPGADHPWKRRFVDMRPRGRSRGQSLAAGELWK